MQVKADIRRELISTRVPGTSKFWKSFIDTEIYKDCETLLTYVSVKNEPDTRGLIEYALISGKRVFVPKTYGDGRMTFYRIQSQAELTVAGSFGIPEPCGDSEAFKDGDGDKSPVGDRPAGSVCVIPALCYNSDLQRIGYGGGYYDRFLSGAGRNTTKVLFCGVRREFTADDFDVPADMVINGY